MKKIIILVIFITASLLVKAKTGEELIAILYANLEIVYD